MIKKLINFDGELLLHLNTLVAVSEAESYHQAARNLGISQPTVSHHMKALEKRMQSPLTKAVGKSRKLTPLAIDLANVASAQFNQLQVKILSSMNEHQKEFQILRVAGRPEILQHVISQLKPSRMTCHVVSAQQAVELLQQGKVELAISHIEPDSPNVISKKAFTSKPELVVHKDLWGTGNKVNIEKLRMLPALVYRKDGDSIAELFMKLKIDPGQIKKQIICEDWSVIKSMVEHKRGYSIIPDYVAGTVSDRVHKIDLSEFSLASYTYFYLYRKEDKNLAKHWI